MYWRKELNISGTRPRLNVLQRYMNIISQLEHDVPLVMTTKEATKDLDAITTFLYNYYSVIAYRVMNQI